MQFVRIAAILAIIAAIGWLFWSQQSSESQPIACTLDAKICPDGSVVGRVAPDCEFAACPVPGDGDAGGATLYDDFNLKRYEAARARGDLVILYFHANWCPVCVKEWPEVQAAFEALDEPSVTGFLVNFNDEETDADERALAREFGIAYQHTKVFLKGDEQLLKTLDTWTRDRYITEITAALNGSYGG